ncbi:hypothetical protein GLOIN_2v1770077 [Rhizophagus irregularis DAOM 181602=DAOM 197198]|uniref:Uncharacterized protein n=1 Tax=Rhizophagus irregularis (strain DAOM 181602 / DAOM 197198 / MUCL 43194) TaxID=747089 RepID=A0A2P4QCT2_RHIID|nr:hypothetical protein GLOIN_2v1770077 [Rhizophagus irregularis DAOM 181602=DAOM 197198]POG75432.1 hypothetical protein GLOIN_2v1770077 [Rhizophagus irregularis DAOM 181602=DAOM 197198]|eukprot:XP_025182298.1 hypothetical protein GLOIN_2v1770077 [Rhizophagus irregularis DAOM 181602=DAOM 197198]
MSNDEIYTGCKDFLRLNHDNIIDYPPFTKDLMEPGLGDFFEQELLVSCLSDSGVSAVFLTQVIVVEAPAETMKYNEIISNRKQLVLKSTLDAEGLGLLNVASRLQSRKITLDYEDQIAKLIPSSDKRSLDHTSANDKSTAKRVKSFNNDESMKNPEQQLQCSPHETQNAKDNTPPLLTTIHEDSTLIITKTMILLTKYLNTAIVEFSSSRKASFTKENSDHVKLCRNAIRILNFMLQTIPSKNARIYLIQFVNSYSYLKIEYLVRPLPSVYFLDRFVCTKVPETFDDIEKFTKDMVELISWQEINKIPYTAGNSNVCTTPLEDTPKKDKKKVTKNNSYSGSPCPGSPGSPLI